MSRREYDEGYEDARREIQEREFGSSRCSGRDFIAAFLVLIIAYVVLQILNAVQDSL